MIETKIIDSAHKADINIPNEPFTVVGQLVPSYNDGWTYKILHYTAEEIHEMCFPDEHYDFDAMQNSVFVGAYDNDQCVGLAILQPALFKYMYLYDLKVNKLYRGQRVGTLLVQKSKEIALANGYKGLYTQCQDNNLAACLFYVNCGFYIGGLDTNVYRHTSQQDKSDIIFYCEAKQK